MENLRSVLCFSVYFWFWSQITSLAHKIFVIIVSKLGLCSLACHWKHCILAARWNLFKFEATTFLFNWCANGRNDENENNSCTNVRHLIIDDQNRFTRIFSKIERIIFPPCLTSWENRSDIVSALKSQKSENWALKVKTILGVSLHRQYKTDLRMENAKYVKLLWKKSNFRYPHSNKAKRFPIITWNTRLKRKKHKSNQKESEMAKVNNSGSLLLLLFSHIEWRN